MLVCHLGVIPYRKALDLQQRVCTLRQRDLLPDTLLLLEHPPVYTRGRRSLPNELSLGEDFYRARGIEVVETNRGGRVTYHGPGQLVGYPIMRLTDIGGHLRRIEAAIVAALADAGVQARSRCAEGPDFTGVWIEERKIASIGVHVSRGVSTHGFAVNVDNNLDPFDWVIACGLPDVQMTSLARELARREDVFLERGSELARASEPIEQRGPLLDGFREPIAERLCAACGRRLRAISARELQLRPAGGEEAGGAIHERGQDEPVQAGASGGVDGQAPRLLTGTGGRT